VTRWVIIVNLLKDKIVQKTGIVFLLLIIIFEIISYSTTEYVKGSLEVELYRKSYAIEAEIEKTFNDIFHISSSYKSFMEANPSATK